MYQTHTHTHTCFIAVLCIGEVRRKCVLYIHIVHPAAHFKAANLICVCYTYICRKRSAVLADHGPVDHGLVDHGSMDHVKGKSAYNYLVCVYVAVYCHMIT